MERIYPHAKRDDTRDDYHGTVVDDPYRWLEDLDSEDTAEFVRVQNERTEKYLAGIPARASLKARITALWDFERFSLPFRRGAFRFWLHNDGLQDQAVLYRSIDEAEPVVLIDPNTWSIDGTAALNVVSPTEDGSLLAFSIARAGSDIEEWRVIDTTTGSEFADRIERAKFCIAAWAPDNSGFYYSRFDEPANDESPDRNHALYFHHLGTAQDADEPVFAAPDHPDWMVYPAVHEDGRWLVLTVSTGASANNGIFVIDLHAHERKAREIVAAVDAHYDVFSIEGATAYVTTDLDAPRGRVIAIDLDHPSRDTWTEILPQSTDILTTVGACGGVWFAQYLADAHSRVKMFTPDGTFVREVDLPGVGSAFGFEGRRSDTDTFFSFDTFTEPTQIFRTDIATGTTTAEHRSTLQYDPDVFETSQVFVASKDGTSVPLFLIHRRGLVLDGSNPTFLYGYGGFRVAMTPGFPPALIAWMEQGGVYAVAVLRGGNEYGEAWHAAGMKEKKQNVFDDFIATAEWLIDNGYTSSARLAIGGGSNGGLLVGACMTQRPELFAAARIGVGVLDMLRFHRFTIGWAWVSEYGSADIEAEFPALYAYSPLHNITPQTAYPATIITTGDHDDRVVPSHSFKFAATLQPAQGGRAPILLRVDVRAGHGLGKPTTKMIEEATDVWAFLGHHTSPGR